MTSNATTELQTTRSREAYEAQQPAFVHRSFSSGVSRRSRPQSAGAAGGWDGRRDRRGSRGGGGGGGVSKEGGFPSPPSYPPPAYYRSCSPGIGGGGRGTAARLAHVPPSLGCRFDGISDVASVAAAAASGDQTDVRLGKPRTRVRPSSANARVYGRSGIGQGVGLAGEGGWSGAGGIPRRVHVPRQKATTGSDGGNSTTGMSKAQVRLGDQVYIVSVRVYTSTRVPPIQFSRNRK